MMPVLPRWKLKVKVIVIIIIVVANSTDFSHKGGAPATSGIFIEGELDI